MITLLTGGTGSVKVARGLSKITKDLVIISNVADNIWIYGLYVCPDIDTILYGLAGILDKDKGWGVINDSFMFMEQMKELGQEYWFKIGDKDLALHVLRTNFLRKRKSLSWITKWLRRELLIDAIVLPASDDHFETRIETSSGEMHIQDYWVRNHGELEIRRIKYAGIRTANPNPEAVQSIRKSDLIIIAPGNPISSIGPIISLPSIRNALESRKNDVIAISPIMGNSALSGPASKYLRAMGIDSSPSGIALYYSNIASNLVISKSDDTYEKQIKMLGVNVFKTNIVMQNAQDEINLSNYVLNIMNKL